MNDEANEPTAVSVVVPLRDEAASVVKLIDALRRQTLAPREVLLVDGGSTDSTVQRVREAAAGDLRFRIIEAGEATPGRGRNVGTAAAVCQWIAYTDAGGRPELDWLERLAAEAQSHPGVDVVFGNFEPVAETLVQRAAALSYVQPKRRRAGGRLRAPAIVSALMRRSVWEDIGGFPDLRASEDLAFLDAIERGPFLRRWAPAATVWWDPPPTLAATFRRFETLSIHNVRAGKAHLWHYGVARQYAIAAAIVLIASIFSPWWLLLIPTGLVARVWKLAWPRSERGWAAILFDPVNVVVAAVLLTIDAATFVGWIEALLGPVRPRKTTSVRT